MTDAKAKAKDAKPEVTAESLLEGGRVRQSLRLIQRAVANNWPIPEAVVRSLPGVLAGMIGNGSLGERERLRAAELMATLQRDNLSALTVLDKVERLEHGLATERIAVDDPESVKLADAILAARRERGKAADKEDARAVRRRAAGAGREEKASPKAKSPVGGKPRRGGRKKKPKPGSLADGVFGEDLPVDDSEVDDDEPFVG